MIAVCTRAAPYARSPNFGESRRVKSPKGNLSRPKHLASEFDDGGFLLAQAHYRLVVFNHVDDGRLDMARIVRVPPVCFQFGPFILGVQLARRHQNGDLDQPVGQSGVISEIALFFVLACGESGIAKETDGAFGHGIAPEQPLRPVHLVESLLSFLVHVFAFRQGKAVQ